MKVTDLKGHLLDDWVARCHGWTKYLDEKDIWWWHVNVSGDEVGILQTTCDSYQPSSDWNTGGQLLDDAGIFVMKTEPNPAIHPGTGYYSAGHAPTPAGFSNMTGETYLQAGMRFFVYLKFGSDVEDDPNWRL